MTPGVGFCIGALILLSIVFRHALAESMAFTVILSGILILLVATSMGGSWGKEGKRG